MKINPPTENPVVSSANAASVAAKAGAVAAALAKPTPAQTAQTTGVAVTVSNLARTMVSDPASQTADMDMAKVKAVKNAIAQGTYVVNPGAIADKLLSNAQEMLVRSKV
jgi:negative regulator of flagellin synthesis FlgM